MEENFNGKIFNTKNSLNKPINKKYEEIKKEKICYLCLHEASK